MDCNFTKIENNFSQYIISTLGPNKEHDYSRENKFKSIKNIIQNGFAAEQDIIPHVYSFGSFPLRTYLPDSDMDITVILEDKNTNKIISDLSYEYLNKILFVIKSSLEKYNQERGYQQITDINIILADVKLIKCKFGSLSFDISINNFVGLCKLIFVHYIENKSFNRILFKRSLFLIKYWCYHEGSVLGSNVGLLASYALEILIIYMFNNYSDKFINEVGALFTFFKMMNEIDWDKSIITIFGCLNIDTFYEKLKLFDFNLESLLKEMIVDKNCLIDFEETVNFEKTFEKFADMDKIQNFFSNKKAITTKYINIIDPMFHTNNLGKSVNYNNYSKIKKVFEFVNKQSCRFEKDKSIRLITPCEYLNYLLNLFNKTVIANSQDLFSVYLSRPKIVIRPKLDSLSEDEIEIEKSKNVESEEVVDNLNNEIDAIIKRFNAHYAIEDNISSISENNESNPMSYTHISGQIINNTNKVSSFENTQELRHCYTPDLATKEIIELVMNNDDKDSYNFESSLDINNIEEFINNCI